MTRVKIANWDAFYKYGTFSRIERIRPMLCERKFYFAPPSQLNDPSDCRNLVKDHSAEEIEEFLIETNRQFYGDARGDEYIRRGIQQFGAIALLDEMSKQFNKIMDSRYGVFSLAKRSNNMALWAKYADDHKGYCLEFSDLSEFSFVYEVIYADKRPLSLNLAVDPSEVDFLYTKTPEWSSEEEARILSKPPGLQVLPKSALKAIILGEHCDPKNEKIVLGWIEECHADIDVKKAKFNGARQKLEFLTITSSRPPSSSAEV
jgi:hypothetical protein